MHKLLIILPLMLLTGCVEQNRIEKLGMSDVVAIDSVYHESGKMSLNELEIAVSIPQAGSLDRQALILKTKSASPKEGRSNLSRKIDKVLVSGQLRSMLFSKDMAKMGILKNLDSYRRDYTVGERLKIAVVNGSAIELLSHKYAQIPSIGNHIDQLLTQTSKIHEVPDVSLYSFVRDYFDDGTDPIAPILALKKDNVEVDGIALFKKDRYIGKINPNNTVLFAILHERVKFGEFNIRFMDHLTGQEERAMLSSVISKRQVHIIQPNQASSLPRIVIRVKMSGNILEYTGTSTFKKPEEQKTICQDLSSAIREKLQGIAEQVQRSGGDNLGVGAYVRNSMSYEAWKAYDWDTLYPQVNIRVEVDATIRDYGMIR